SVQRMSDAQNRIMRAERRPDTSSDAFWYVRAKLRIEQARAGQALRSAEEALRAEARQAQGVQQSAAWYGLAYSAVKRRDFTQAREALNQARAQGQDSAQLAGLDVAIALGQGDVDAALSLSATAVQRWQDSQGVALARIDALQKAGRDAEAVDALQMRIKQWPEVPRLWQLVAQSQEKLGR